MTSLRETAAIEPSALPTAEDPSADTADRTIGSPQSAVPDPDHTELPEEAAAAGDPESPAERRRRRRKLRRPVSRPKTRFRRWLQAHAESRWATPAMCMLSFTDSCISPVLPEILLVPMSVAHPEKRWAYAAWASLASVLGGAFGYALGFLLWNNGLDQLAYAWLPGFTEAKFEEISALYVTSAFVVVFLAGFTPLPFKLFTVTAGVCCIDFGTFMLASATSRTARFFLEIHLLHRLGMPLMDWIANKSRLMTWILLVLLGITVALRLAIPLDAPT